jgi:hypothetical protein
MLTYLQDDIKLANTEKMDQIANAKDVKSGLALPGS